jgi:nucleoside-diphosphate-sugar epimerase
MSALEKKLPERIETEAQLEEFLTRPSPVIVEFIKTLSSPLLILGAGGKMGPTLALLAKRAAELAQHSLRVIAVSRFGDPAVIARLNKGGVETLRSDLLQAQSIKALPEAANILYLVGLKFGTTQNPSTTWAINTIVPTQIAERFCASRIVALSTGNVYPLSEPRQGGSVETDDLTPLGEYSNASVARERLFEFHSRLNRSPVALLRLFYAVELRYGVLTDIARKVYQGEPIDLANGYFNCIWQGDANEAILRALVLAASPPSVWNLCRPEIFSVRAVATAFAQLFSCEPRFTGQEAPSALVANSSLLCSRLGSPAVQLETMLPWIADWVRRGGRDLGRPTHFESRDGRY